MYNVLLPFRPRAALQSGGSSLYSSSSSLDMDFQASWHHQSVHGSLASEELV